MPKIHNATAASGRDDWTTPPELFKRLDEQFRFVQDVAADASNTLCASFIPKEMDAFKTPWRSPAFCNPPYGRGIFEWVKRADRMMKENVLSVLLLPASTDTQWFHLAARYAQEIRLLKGRLIFGNVRAKDGSVGVQPATFPSAIIVFDPAKHFWFRATINAWDWK